MDHLHIRLPAELKDELKRHCRDQNIAVTSAIIMMIVKELREHTMTKQAMAEGNLQTASLGFVLRQ